jgi:hypothetical protein
MYFHLSFREPKIFAAICQRNYYNYALLHWFVIGSFSVTTGTLQLFHLQVVPLPHFSFFVIEKRKKTGASL